MLTDIRLDRNRGSDSKDGLKPASCLDGQCFRAKIDKHLARTIEKKPALVQISTAHNSREGAPL